MRSDAFNHLESIAGFPILYTALTLGQLFFSVTLFAAFLSDTKASLHDKAVIASMSTLSLLRWRHDQIFRDSAFL